MSLGVAFTREASKAATPNLLDSVYKPMFPSVPIATPSAISVLARPHGCWRRVRTIRRLADAAGQQDLGCAHGAAFRQCPPAGSLARRTAASPTRLLSRAAKTSWPRACPAANARLRRNDQRQPQRGQG